MGAVQRYTMQRPKRVENWGEDIELKARSQPMGTCFSVRTSAGCDLRLFSAKPIALKRAIN
jgi:hypothetical protein